MTTKKGILWQVIHTSSELRVLLYFLLFGLQVIIFTAIFHSIYPMLEGKPIDWPQSFLFVVETITTTGYGELLPFHNQTTILFTTIVLMTGVIMIFMVIPLILTPYLVAVLHSAPPKKAPHELFRHIVIIGYNELTRSLIESLMISDKEILIVEKDEIKAREIARKNRKRAYVIWGSYDNLQTWENAWVKNADSVIISENERTTASIILGIRGMTKAPITAVVDKISFDRYLRYAGAEYVLSPKHATGRILARHAVLNPTGDTAPEIPGLDRLNINMQLHPEKELRLINIPVMPGCVAVGKSLQELHLYERFGILVLYLWKAGTFIPQPEPEEIVDATSSLFLFGRAGAITSAVHEEFEIAGKARAHAVIAGFGDVGSAAYHEMMASGIPCTVVDLRKYDVNQVIGNAEDEQVLKQARIEDAQFCIVALNNDDVNIFTTLMARNLNPGIRILARANEPASVDKLYRAGADYVALLPMIGGQTIGRIILADTVTILLDLPDGEMVVLKHVMTSYGFTVRQVSRRCGVRIIGIEAPERLIVAPPDDELVREGDALIVVGDTEQLKKFIRLI
ncbi:MAG: NAD-binding protein [Methanoregula sp.]|nr:NAD-binding protein [Methanoregula sp.]